MSPTRVNWSVERVCVRGMCECVCKCVLVCVCMCVLVCVYVCVGPTCVCVYDMCMDDMCVDVFTMCGWCVWLVCVDVC